MRAAAGAATLFLALAATGCGTDSTSTTPAAQPSSSSASAPVAGGCRPAQPTTAAPKQYPAEPPLTVRATTYTGTIRTNCGDIVLAMDAAKAPHTVNSFAFLAAANFFDNTPCHRLTGGGSLSVLQCGDPTGTGTGGPAYTIPDENLSGATYPAGTVAMANTGQPHTGGSQFFLVYADSTLPPQYTPFARVTAGLDVLKAIAAAGSDNANQQGDGAPKAGVVITDFTVTPGG